LRLRIPSVLVIALVAGACVGCSAPGTGAEPTELADGKTVAAAESEPTAAEPTPATVDEIRAICRVFRQATYGRWDDQRTRGEIGGLDLESDVAATWQRQISEPDGALSLAATRAVLDAAHEAGVASACEPLEGLVAVASGLAATPTADQAAAETSSGSP